LTPRQPSIVPFLVLSGLAALLALLLPVALLSESLAVGAVLILLIAVAVFFAVSLANFGLKRSLKTDFSLLELLVPALWLLSLVGFAQQKNPLALLLVLPFVYSLGKFFPQRAAPGGGAFAAGMGLHAALALHFLGQSTWALLLMLLIAALVVWAAEFRKSTALYRVASALIAILLGLYLFRPKGAPGGGDSAYAATAIATRPGPVQPSNANALRGVILRPKVEEKDIQLPPPPVLRAREQSSSAALDLEIPFSGVYWVFQYPMSGPPEQSPTVKGSPMDYRFRSDDPTPIRLEARQSLPKPFPSGRIQSIGVTLLNQDIFPGTISLDLIATSSKDRRMKIWLGSVPVAHMGERKSVPQTLQYSMPSSPLLSEFDGLILSFMLLPPRVQIVPRVSVQKFVIRPR
jgi:hypothetical protein